MADDRDESVARTLEGLTVVATGSLQHAITSGIEFIDEEQYNPTYVGLGTPITPANLYHPDRNDAQPGYAPVRNGVYTRGETQTAWRIAYALYRESFGGIEYE